MAQPGHGVVRGRLWLNDWGCPCVWEPANPPPLLSLQLPGSQRLGPSVWGPELLHTQACTCNILHL